jgi:peptide-methionine (S)-S-oxide reductase
MIRFHIGQTLWIGPALLTLFTAIVGCAMMPPGAGPDGTGRRHKMEAKTPPAGKEIATLAGGCFWCTEAIFRELKGVESVEPGYAGGTVANPSYEQVCTGETGHAESIQIVFDPKVISFHDLLRIFFTTHDPTTLNQQGNDYGTQYRSAVFYHSEAQKATAVKTMHEIEEAHIWPNKLVTEVTKFTNFYPAEDYHQNYFARNPNQGYCRIIIAPKVAKFRDHYRALLKK